MSAENTDQKIYEPTIMQYFSGITLLTLSSGGSRTETLIIVRKSSKNYGVWDTSSSDPLLLGTLNTLQATSLKSSLVGMLEGIINGQIQLPAKYATLRQSLQSCLPVQLSDLRGWKNTKWIAFHPTLL